MKNTNTAAVGTIPSPAEALKAQYTPSIESRELALYAINSGNLYRGRVNQIMNALAKRVNNGSYEASKAVTAFEYAAREAAEAYCKEFGGTVAQCFPKPCRRAAAAEMLNHYAEEITERATENAKPRYTIAQVKRANATAGQYFFSAETVRFWGSKVESSVYQNCCFVTSERDYTGEKRLYTVRRFHPHNGHISTVGEFQAYATKEAAKAAAMAEPKER